MSKQFWGILAVIAVIFVGAVLYTNHNKSTSTTSAKPTSHIEGKGSTGVKLIEYGDYQCPICGEFYSAVKQTQAKYNDQIYFQFRNLPLTSLHPNAFAAARAAEAAGLQGKYFPMHDLLYENQNTWSSSSDPLDAYFKSYAKSLGLNLQQFTADYQSSKVNSAINADIAAFKKTGDDEATPTFYLDGKKLDNMKLIDKSGVPSVSAFSQFIDQAIASKQAGSKS